MRVSTQVRLVQWSMTAATLLLAVSAALSAAALIHLGTLHLRMVSAAQVAQVRADLTSALETASVTVVMVAAVAVFMRRPSGKVRVAVWIVAPLVSLTTLCFLVGGPEWAVEPTGAEPELLREEYAQVVPAWYVWPHGTAGLLAVALLIFTAVFMTRTDLREHYMDAGDDPKRPYRSWVERTGGP
ncbi:hypothetical protein [Dactylosporangium sp. CA-233914]|uniref:hypothetical protein n=1 Tax=Dactylosporangium sp. CA-233914 TaxID=3239934 RepID=UPI003D91C8CE